MIRVLGSFFLALLLVSLQVWIPGEAHDVCERTKIADDTNVPGFCFQRGLEVCNQTREYRHGCSGKSGNSYAQQNIKPNCSLCVTDDNACLTKKPCEDVNGMCVNSTDACDKFPMAPSNKFCNGPDCFCCGDGCSRNQTCKDLGGYCRKREDWSNCTNIDSSKCTGPDGDCACCWE